MDDKSVRIAQLMDSIDVCRAQRSDYEARVRGLSADIRGMEKEIVQLKGNPIVICR